MYAGPVGWFGGGESEFAVGIRSALVEKVSCKFECFFMPHLVCIVWHFQKILIIIQSD